MKQVRRLALGLLISLLPTLSWADWACTKPETEMPAAQKETFARALLAMRAALLVPPEGWTMNQPSVRSAQGKLCVDFKNEALVFGVSTAYVVKPTAEALRRYRAAQVAQRKEIDALRKYPADVQTKLDAFNAENTQLRKEAREAERAKNSELAKAKYAQAQDVSRKSYALTNEYSLLIQPKEREIYKKFEPELALNRDVLISVSLQANDVLRGSTGDTERVVYGSNIRTTQATDKVVRVVATVEARPGATAAQIATVKGLIDAAKLKAIVGGNIPPAEESQALISKQSEAIASLDTKARELERAIEVESRRAEEAEQIAQRQAREAEQASKSDKPTTAAATTPPPSTTTAAAANAKPASPPPPPPPAPAAPTSNPADVANQAKDTVNKLRGLFGR
jgi:hypothetical protein